MERLSHSALDRELAARPGWELEGRGLVRELAFRDFEEAMGFMERVGQTAVDYERRPDMCISGGRVRLTIENLHRAGLTMAEMRLASKVDAVLEEAYA
jgi:4a-hydroxytetrahydrobiopterin dehydratase